MEYIFFQIFWEEELFGNTYEDYWSVFGALCPAHILGQATSCDTLESSYSSLNNETTTDISIELGDEQNRNKLMRIYIKSLTGKTIPLECSELDTIERIKTMYHKKDGVPPNEQRLIFAGTQFLFGLRLLLLGY